MGMAKWNKAVQESELFGTVKNMFLEKDLVGKSRVQALKQMDSSIQNKYSKAMDGLKKSAPEEAENIASRTKDFRNLAEDNRVNYNIDRTENPSPWKNATEAEKGSIRNNAAGRSALSGSMPGNAGADLEQYNSAIAAAKRSARTRTAGNMASGYYAKPFQDGRVGTGIARAGATAAAVGTVGAITYSLTGGGAEDYSSNYSESGGDF